MPYARSRSARTAMSVHPDPEPRRFGRFPVIVPALLDQPSLRLRDMARIANAGQDIGGIVLSAADNIGGIGAALDRSFEFQSRRLPGVGMRVPGGVNLPEIFKLIISAILCFSSAHGSMQIDHTMV